MMTADARKGMPVQTWTSEVLIGGAVLPGMRARPRDRRGAHGRRAEPEDDEPGERGLDGRERKGGEREYGERRAEIGRAERSGDRRKGVEDALLAFVRRLAPIVM